MRSLFMAGTAGLFLALGAADAHAVPQNSPYATMVPPGAVDGYNSEPAPMYGDQDYGDATIEGRSAYVDPDYDAYPYYGNAYPNYRGGFYFGGGHFGHHFGGGHFNR